ncbi:hypothetical protein F4604DRAFT_1941110 [Suillus subluteus]|nr:hypothetical protein F4604DRAFT_1941110 [Suillus subluteus]
MSNNAVTSYVQSVQNAKAKAIENAGHLEDYKMKTAAEEPAERAPMKKKNCTSSTGNGMVCVTAGSRPPGNPAPPKNHRANKPFKWYTVVDKVPAKGKVTSNLKKHQLGALAVAKLRTKSKRLVQPEQDLNAPSIDDEFFADEPEDASDFQPSSDEGDTDTDADLEQIEDDSDDCIVKSLSAETPTFVSKAEQLDFPLTQPTWPRATVAASKSKLPRMVEPFPFSSAQPRVPTKKRKPQSAHDKKQVHEMPIWVDDSPSEEDCHDGVTSGEHYNSSKGNSVDHDAQADHIHDHDHTSGGPKLVRTDTGKIKLTDQDLDTHRVVQRAILEAKVHMTFVNGYPELTEKGLFTRDALLTVSRTCGVPPIQNRLKTDNSYCMALATLDNACAQVTAYYHLGPDCADAAKNLPANHVYHYMQHFDDKNVAIPQVNKPYSTDILPYLMKGRYFKGPKSVGIKFSDRFKEIASNKAQRPEVTIPMVALTTTLVCAALFWKSSGSPSKFNFTGNLFSEVYLFHVKFLENLRWDVPGKFHRLMADIFEAIWKLSTNGNSGIGLHNDAMAVLDLAGMDDDSEYGGGQRPPAKHDAYIS